MKKALIILLHTYFSPAKNTGQLIAIRVNGSNKGLLFFLEKQNSGLTF